LFVALAVLLTAAVCLAAEPARANQDSSKAKSDQPDREKAKALREAAQDLIRVGIAQTRRGLYQQAEESFLNARAYQEYLTAKEQEDLETYLTEAHKAGVERQAVLEHIRKARELLGQNKPITARAYYEKVRNSPYLTEQERKQITQEIKTVDSSLDRQRKEITELYNRSVALYRAGEFEKARDGFAEVARSGLLVAPRGQTAEDYLLQIDSILTEQPRGTSPAESNLVSLPPAQPNIQDESTPAGQAAPQDSESELLKTGPEAQLAKQQHNEKQQAQQETNEVTVVAEPSQQKPVVAATSVDARTKLIRTYTKAVVEDAATKVKDCLNRGEFNKAVATVRRATQVVGENRSFIGDDSLAQYSIQLKQLADDIIRARKM